MRSTPFRLAGCLAPVFLFLIVLGMRWGIDERFGMALPDWDQWDAEGIHLLAPWYQGRLTWAEMLRPHNEHRVVITKLVNLGLTVANGQWDQRVEVVINSLLPALFAALLFCSGRRHLGGAWPVPLFGLLAVLFGLPLAWENIVNGFHSQQYFLIVLSGWAIARLPFTEPGSLAWWGGALSLVLAIGSMASGVFAAVVVAGLAAVRIGSGRLRARAAAPTLILCAAVFAVACIARVSVSYHAGLKAQSVADFIMTIVRALGWPGFGRWWGWFAVALWLPWFWLARLAWKNRKSGLDDFATLLLGLGAWVLLQVLATAYARGAGGPGPASRYVDTLAVGTAVNGICLAWLWQRPAVPRGLLASAGIGWVVIFVSSAGAELAEIYAHQLLPVRQQFYYCEANVRHFLASGDRTFLEHPEIPYPGTDALIDRLNIPELRRILPVTVRLPMDLTPAPAAAGFVRADTRAPQLAPERSPGGATGLSPATPLLSEAVTWGSFGRNGAARAGPWQSEPLATTLHGWLRFEVAGDAGEAGSALELREPATGRLLAAVQPDHRPGNSWRSAYVRAPAGPFVVTASEQSTGRWLAFSEPVEMGVLSYWAWRAVRRGFLLAEIASGGAALLALSAAAAAAASRSPARSR